MWSPLHGSRALTLRAGAPKHRMMQPGAVFSTVLMLSAVTAFGDLVRRPPKMRAVAIVAQNPAHGPALDVAIDAATPGIDLERQQCFARLDNDPRPLVHFYRLGLHARNSVNANDWFLSDMERLAGTP